MKGGNADMPNNEPLCADVLKVGKFKSKSGVNAPMNTEQPIHKEY